VNSNRTSKNNSRNKKIVLPSNKKNKGSNKRRRTQQQENRAKQENQDSQQEKAQQENKSTQQGRNEQPQRVRSNSASNRAHGKSTVREAGSQITAPGNSGAATSGCTLRCSILPRADLVQRPERERRRPRLYSWLV